MENQITTTRLLTAHSLAASAVKDSGAVDLRHIMDNGRLSVSYTITGTGTVKLEYLAAPTKDGPFIEPAGASDIGTGLTVGSGSFAFTPILTPFIKIRATETGAANAAVLTLDLNVQ